MARTNKIVSLNVTDVRFPTSDGLDGSDATNKDPDYSAAYIAISTEQGDQGDQGYSLIFTIGRGNDLCCKAVEAMQHLVVGVDFGNIMDNVGEYYKFLRSDSQLRWLGPENGVINMAVGGIMNAIWDMWARHEKKPVWRLLCDMTPEEFVNCLDFRYVTDALSRDEAMEILKANESGKAERIRFVEENGIPAYTTSAGWLGYDDQKLVALCRQAVDEGYSHVKLKVGENLEDDIRRCKIARQTIGENVKLLIDANQKWDVDEAIDWVNALSVVNPWLIEEPTSPDDVLGHKTIRENVSPILVASGEHCQNRIMFKQFIVNDAIDVVQIDSCRLASINEILTVCLMASKYGKPVCPHAGGVGLCEYVQHLSIIDYVRISADLTGRVVEYVDNLHEHFEDPCIISNGAYVVPNKPGFSVKMYASTLDSFQYPNGKEWQSRLAAVPAAVNQ